MNDVGSELPPHSPPISRRQFLQILKLSGIAGILTACGIDPNDFNGVEGSDAKATLTAYEKNPADYKKDLYDLLIHNRNVFMQSVELSFMGHKKTETGSTETKVNADGYIIVEQGPLCIIATTAHRINEMQLDSLEITQPHFDIFNMNGMQHYLSINNPLFKTETMHIAHYPESDLALIFFLKDALLDGEQDYIAQFQTEPLNNKTPVVGITFLPILGNKDYPAFPIIGETLDSNEGELIIHAATLPGASGQAVAEKETSKIIGIVQKSGDPYNHTVLLTHYPPENEFETFINEKAQNFLRSVGLESHYSPIHFSNN